MLFENLISGILATLIGTLIIKIFSNLKTKSENESTPNQMVTSMRMIKLARNQFFFVLLYLLAVIAFLVSGLTRQQTVLVFISVTSLFSFILLWGSFDLVYKVVQKSFYQGKQNATNQKGYNKD